MARKKKVSSEKPYVEDLRGEPEVVVQVEPEVKPVEKVRRYFGSGRVWGGENIIATFDAVTKSLDTSDQGLWEKLDRIGFKYDSDPVDELVVPEPPDPLYTPPIKGSRIKV